MSITIQPTKTNNVVKEAMKIALRDVRLPKVVREGVVEKIASPKKK